MSAAAPRVNNRVLRRDHLRQTRLPRNAIQRGYCGSVNAMYSPE